MNAIGVDNYRCRLAFGFYFQLVYIWRFILKHYLALGLVYHKSTFIHNSKVIKGAATTIYCLHKPINDVRSNSGAFVDISNSRPALSKF